MYAPSPAAPRQRRRRVLVSALCASLLVAATVVTLTAKSRPEPKDRPPDVASPVELGDRVGSYTALFPLRSGYRPPSREERAAVRAGVMDVLDGRIDSARSRLGHVGYTVRTMRLKGSERAVAEIAEREGEDTGRGWGRVYVDLSRSARFSVQVPHPRADMNSELMGAELFAKTPGAVLVLAGANRFAGQGKEADMAHQARSVFNAVCAALTARGLPGVQLHGFANESSPGNDVVLSPGVTEPGPEIRRAARLISDAGLRTCRTWVRSCGQLEGTTNVQGRDAAAHGIPFLHVENSHTVRTDAAGRSAVVDALDEAARGWNGR
ncbi:hypothetical protein [Wenjunlia tyrosinilytica]|nr:hypothetical protein [Wenjunlia tyrosinilytica]